MGKPAASPAEHADGTGGCAADEADGADGDQKQIVLKRILAAHETWFDVQRDYEYAGCTFPGYAEFHSHGEKYVLVKRAKLWEVDVHEYIFFLVMDHLGESGFDGWVDFMKTEALNKVDPVPDHMTSYLSLVVVADTLDAALVKKVRKTRFRKDFMLGVRGWADLRVAVVDVSSQRVYTNSAGQKMQETLEANLSPADVK